jgi:cell division protein DivIC
MIRPQSIWNFIARFKYQTVILIGIVVVGFLDENSFWNRFKHQREISQLKQEIRKYDDMYRSDTAQLYQLDHNPKAIEKIARERYFMKADDEDIFVLSDDKQKTNDNNETAE